MKKQYGLVISQHCYLHQRPGFDPEHNDSGIEDEIFSGWAVVLYPDTEENGWIKAETHYGYKGYVRCDCLRRITVDELRKRQEKERFFRMGVPAADLHQNPKVQGLPLELILKNAFVELLQREAVEGWSRIRTAAGREGYVHTVYLKKRMEDDGYLLNMCDSMLPKGSEVLGGDTARQAGSRYGNVDEKTEGYFRTRFRQMELDEEAFRSRVADSARAYLGTQYRWGGKSSQGLDCSGLVFMSYFENGVIIYRDAHILPEYPVNAITAEELKKGDLIFFPGHVALYLGDGRYIHSTAYAATPCVTINSLNPGDPDYRADLLEKIEGYGSVFDGEKAEKDSRNTADENGSQATATKAAESEQTENNGDTDGAGNMIRENAVEKNACRSIAASYWTSLDERLAALPGSISFVFKDLTSGDAHTYREDEPQLAASIIKLFLMAAVFQGMEDGTIHADDLIDVRRSDCVPSCGVLTYLPEERRVSVRDLVELMIIVSDNTAANLLFDLVGEETLAHFIRDTLGMQQTVFRRKMFDSVRAAQGIENYVTAADAAVLLEKIWRRELVSAQASETMYQILTHQRLNGKIPFRLHARKPQPVIAHKTGEDTGITHDVAIIAGEHPFLLCFLGSSTDVPAYERLMADVAEEIFSAIDGGNSAGRSKR